MKACAVVVFGPSGPIPVYEVKLGSEVLVQNADGYWEGPRALGPTYIRVLATGYAPVVYPVTLDNQNQTIRFGGAQGAPNDILFPALTPSFKLPPVNPRQWRGAFCIPGALPGIPYGDGQRIWTPAFGCYRGTSWQDQMITQLKARSYSWLEYQVSGSPYRGDYPDIPFDVNAIVADLVKIRTAGLSVMLAFRDDQGPDLSYLKPLADVTQGLVNGIWGIYECNGVFSDNVPVILNVLQQQRALWPNAVNGFHSTTQDDGGEGFGDLSFWQAAAQFVDVYLMQQSAWNHTLQATADRAQDYTQRLIGGLNGWPVLKVGLILAEETTSVTYRGQPESYGVSTMDSLMGMISPRPTGYLDGGSVSV